MSRASSDPVRSSSTPPTIFRATEQQPKDKPPLPKPRIEPEPKLENNTEKESTTVVPVVAPQPKTPVVLGTLSVSTTNNSNGDVSSAKIMKKKPPPKKKGLGARKMTKPTTTDKPGSSLRTANLRKLCLIPSVINNREPKERH